MSLQKLVSLTDTRSLIRDRIAFILKSESAAQMILAEADPVLDPQLWRLRVFSDRSNPWDQTDSHKQTPIVNVWAETSSLEGRASDGIHCGVFSTTYHLDCYAFGCAEDTDEGHNPADVAASQAADRASALVRGILSAGQYTYLGFTQEKFFTPEQVSAGALQMCYGRRIESITSFQPVAADRPVDRVQAVRIDMIVRHPEFSQEFEGPILEEVGVSLTKAPSGEWIELEYST